MAVTRDGIPVRVWCWPGNTTDPALIRQVKNDMRDWTLSKIVWVADRGFSSDHNRRYLRRGGHATSSARSCADSPRGQGRAVPAGPLRAPSPTTCGSRRSKVSATTERFVICHNPDGADRDPQVRDQPRRPAAGS